MHKQLRRALYATAGVLLVPVGLGRLPAASACTCVGDVTYSDQIMAADVVFDGIATGVAGPGNGQDLPWTFDVTSVAKGTATDPQTVRTGAHSGVCGITFDVGSHYRVLARREGGELSTGTCSGTRLLTGYRLASADGGVFAFGASGFHGSAGGLRLNAPVVGMASTPSNRGYWLVASDGGVFAYGDARFFGSTGGLPLNAPVVGITTTPTGAGYWLTAADGGVFAYGDARFFGSTGGLRLNAPVVGIAATGSGTGYWMLGADGGIFAYGDARYHGRTSYMAHGSGPNVATAITASHPGTGYWIADRAGGISAFGDTAPVEPLQTSSLYPWVGIARTAVTPGIVVTSPSGRINIYGGSSFGDVGDIPLNAPVVAVSA